MSGRALRRIQIVEAIKAGRKLPEIADHFGVSYRHVAMIAKEAKLSRKRGRPLGSCKQPPAWKPRPARGGYSLQPAEVALPLCDEGFARG